MKPARFNLIVLRSADMERAAAFYARLGLKFTRHAHGSGPEHQASEADGLVFEIYPLTEKSAPTAGVRIGFLVDDVDPVLADLTDSGAVVVSPAKDSEWGRRAVVRDPDGHVIELLARKPAIALENSET